MTARAALCASLLRGDVISIRTGFKDLGITNIPREISRGIEKPFGVIVSRNRREGKSRWGTDCCWFEYRLNKTDLNKLGIEKMREYLKSESKDFSPAPAKENLSQKKLF